MGYYHDSGRRALVVGLDRQMKGPPVARNNPLGIVKDVAMGSLMAPVRAIGSAVSLAKGVASAGRTTSADAAGTERAGDAPSPDRRPKPVDVTAELGLDPAPVAKRKPAKKAPKARPVTKIDAEADASSVDATPADVAEVVSRGGSDGTKHA